MEAVVEVRKPRLTYQQFLAQSKPSLTIGMLIERYIEAMAKFRPLGESNLLLLRRLQREPISRIAAAAVTKADVIRHCEWRRETVCAATVQHDVTSLSVVLRYAGSNPNWTDCEHISEVPVAQARAYLTRHFLISPSTPRSRRPTTDELEMLLAYFDRPERGCGFKRQINMVVMTLWQWYSAMRVGNSCEILWTDWNRDAQTILVRKMKDPKRRNKQKVVALTNQAQQLLIALETIRDPSEPRVFPYFKKSISAAYTNAKKELGIENLHLHDSRRDRATRLVEDERLAPTQAIAFTGHETTREFEKTYFKQDAAKIVRQVNEARLAA